jgi:hypothetical protein
MEALPALPLTLDTLPVRLLFGNQSQGGNEAVLDLDPPAFVKQYLARANPQIPFGFTQLAFHAGAGVADGKVRRGGRAEHGAQRPLDRQNTE